MRRRMRVSRRRRGGRSRRRGTVGLTWRGRWPQTRIDAHVHQNPLRCDAMGGGDAGAGQRRRCMRNAGRRPAVRGGGVVESAEAPRRSHGSTVEWHEWPAAGSEERQITGIGRTVRGTQHTIPSSVRDLVKGSDRKPFDDGILGTPCPAQYRVLRSAAELGRRPDYHRSAFSVARLYGGTVTYSLLDGRRLHSIVSLCYAVAVATKDLP